MSRYGIRFDPVIHEVISSVLRLAAIMGCTRAGCISLCFLLGDWEKE